MILQEKDLKIYMYVCLIKSNKTINLEKVLKLYEKKNH